MHRSIAVWGILAAGGVALAQDAVPNAVPTVPSAVSFTVDGRMMSIAMPNGLSEVQPAPFAGPGTLVVPGNPVEPTAAVSAGTRLAAEWGGRWLAVDVLEAKPDGKLRVHWVGWGDNFDEDMDRARLRFPADPSRPTDTPSASGSGYGRRSSRTRMVPVLPPEYGPRDRNGDGQIGMYEWERGKYSEFTKLDKNGDGFLTPQELSAKSGLLSARLRGGRLEREAQPDPGNLSAYGQRVGESFAFTVTGRATGAVYGTSIYTTDSDLASAAVHAGVIKDGEQGIVQVTIVQTPNQFSGTSANGVMSRSWGAYPTAFTFR